MRPASKRVSWAKVTHTDGRLAAHSMGHQRAAFPDALLPQPAPLAIMEPTVVDGRGARQGTRRRRRLLAEGTKAASARVESVLAKLEDSSCRI